jgi:dTDP-4-dehydrorhamnose 3,5-epimerase-like enzyme
MNYKIIQFEEYGDSRGSLISFEALKNVPFSIKRVYCIYGTNQYQERGRHAHKELEQIIVCLHGSCLFVLDNGSVKETVNLNNPSTGLYIGKNMWREMKDFSKECVLMVLASTYYDEREYIRDYKKFLKVVNCCKL